MDSTSKAVLDKFQETFNTVLKGSGIKAYINICRHNHIHVEVSDTKTGDNILDISVDLTTAHKLPPDIFKKFVAAFQGGIQ